MATSILPDTPRPPPTYINLLHKTLMRPWLESLEGGVIVQALVIMREEREDSKQRWNVLMLPLPSSQARKTQQMTEQPGGLGSGLLQLEMVC